MKAISILVLLGIITFFGIATLEQKEEGAYYIGAIITTMTLIPLVYIFIN